LTAAVNADGKTALPAADEKTDRIAKNSPETRRNDGVRNESEHVLGYIYCFGLYLFNCLLI
jgi:hypothetical protein